jgi:DNA-binding FrmR family transcriptional regulator
MKADKELINRLLRTAAGQIEGIIKMVDEDSIAWIFQIKY